MEEIFRTGHTSKTQLDFQTEERRQDPQDKYISLTALHPQHENSLASLLRSGCGLPAPRTCTHRPELPEIVPLRRRPRARSRLRVPDGWPASSHSIPTAATQRPLRRPWGSRRTALSDIHPDSRPRSSPDVHFRSGPACSAAALPWLRRSSSISSESWRPQPPCGHLCQILVWRWRPGSSPATSGGGRRSGRW
jgi:hypothetical protein